MDLDISRAIRGLANPERAKLSLRYFKTGPGQYGEGDEFIGLTVPQIRWVAGKYRDLSLSDITQLLHSKIHEERQAALFILVDRFRKGDGETKEKIYHLYLANTKYINNWDLVDLTAPVIVGSHLADKDKRILIKLAHSDSVWERRIAILATFWFLTLKEPDETLKIAEILLHDSHDLIHKAVGWALREVGKRCDQNTEEKFLQKHAATMPRTALRYAIEKFPDDRKKYYLNLKYGR